MDMVQVKKPEKRKDDGIGLGTVVKLGAAYATGGASAALDQATSGGFTDMKNIAGAVTGKNAAGEAMKRRLLASGGGS